MLSLILLFASVYNLIQFARQFDLGLSVLLIISGSWFLLRSPNRGNFMALAAFTMIPVFFLSIYLLLVASGEPWISQFGVAAIMISIFTGSFALVLADTAIRKAEELESIEGE